MKRLAVVLCIFLLSMLVGCEDDTIAPPPTGTPGSVVQVRQGEVFLKSNFKIKCVVTPQTANTLDPLTLEVYVDSAGNGTGLAGYKDDVYDVIIANDKVFVKLADTVAVQVTDITGHMIPTSIDVASISDLSSLGFTMVGDTVGAYKTSNSLYILDSTFAPSEATFDAVSIAAGNTMTVTELVDYMINLKDTLFVDQSGDDSQTVITDKGSFWGNSSLGITIHDKIYSIGDYCNPSTYFEELIPETLAPTYAYNGDTKVTLTHSNYQSSDGRTSFMTTEGYVQAISTTCDFTWLKFSRGMDEKDIKEILGVGLSSKEKETWVPFLEGLEVISTNNSQYVVKYSSLTISLQMDSRTHTLKGITMQNYIDFLEEEQN